MRRDVALRGFSSPDEARGTATVKPGERRGLCKE
jgi:hypothetical protein